MARHGLFVQFALPPARVRHKDVVFFVYRGKSKFGELRVSQGAVVWRGRGDKSGRRMPWPRFDELMQEAAPRAERRRPGTRVSVSKKRRRAP
jgi:hypothetical protein